MMKKTPHISQDVHSSHFLLNCTAFSFTPWQELFFSPSQGAEKDNRNSS